MTCALQGHTIYSGMIPDNLTDAWYVLQKAADSNTATVRIVNTTVYGSTSCTGLYGSLDNADGTAIPNISLSENTAVSYPVTAGGSYYIELDDNGCTPSGTTGDPTYSIEPEPGSEWSLDPTSTVVACSPTSVATGSATSCATSVTDTASSGASTPTGTVSFTSAPTSGSFGSAGSCTLAPTGTTGKASYHVTFTPSAGGGYTITASYSGDNDHHASAGSGSLASKTPPASGPGSVTIGGSAKVSSKGVAGISLSCSGAAGAICSGKPTLSQPVIRMLKGPGGVLQASEAPDTVRRMLARQIQDPVRRIQVLRLIAVLSG